MTERRHLKDAEVISPEIIGAQREITRDLMRKVGDDVGAALRRMMEIAPEPLLPIAMSAGTTVIALMALLLDKNPERGSPDPKCLMLAGLLLAHGGISGPDAVKNAYRDLEVLMDADVTRTVEKLAVVHNCRDLTMTIMPLLRDYQVADVLAALVAIIVGALKVMNVDQNKAIDTLVRQVRSMWDKEEPADG